MSNSCVEVTPPCISPDSLLRKTELSWASYHEKYKEGLLQPHELLWPEISLVSHEMFCLARNDSEEGARSYKVVELDTLFEIVTRIARIHLVFLLQNPRL
jgi:hypothetical protein